MNREVLSRADSGRCIAALVCALSVSSLMWGSPAAAQDDSSAFAGEGGAPAPAADPAPESGEHATGMWAAGGFGLMANDGTLSGMRLEFGLPLMDDIPLSLVIPFTFHGRNSGGARLRLLTLLGSLQYEYDLPIEMPGTVSIIGELGVGLAYANVRVSGFGSNGQAGLGLRFVATARYYFETMPNFFVALQPGGATVTILDGDGTGFYDFWAGAGWRFD